MALKPIQILINAKDNASAVFSSLQARVAAVGVAIAGYFGIQAFSGVVKGAADLEQAMSRVQAATGASADELQELRKAAESAGSSSIFTSTEAAGALENLAKAGLSASEAIEALPAALALAQAGDIGLAEASEIVTKAVTGMGLSFAESARVADVLAQGANATNTSVTGLAQALSYAAPVANSLGLSLEDTVAIIGKFADAGIDASRAGTALNSILSQFSNPASIFRKELAAAGITTGDFNEALRQLAAAGPRGQKAVIAVGQEAGPALRALLNQGIGALDDLRGKLQESAGSADEVARVMQSNLNGALSGLSSAWDTVKNALGTPVLPVLKDAVDALANSLRGAVADGTVARFGEAIATAFRSGIEWVRQFVAQIDLTEVAARLQAFATRTGEVFEQIGAYATNAGNTVKLAYGVMSAGVNTVLTAIYGIGAVFAEVASVVMTGIAKLREGLAKVTFGRLSAGFKEAAEDARISAGAFGAAAEAMRAKARESLDEMAVAASTAREGWSGLTAEAEKSVAAVTGSSTAQEEWAATVEKAAQVAAKGAEAATKKAEADKAAAESVKVLRQEYADLIAQGDLQAAALKFEEINQALRGTPAAAQASARSAEEAAAVVSAAFERMGVQTKEALKTQAETARQDYELIKQSGQATAQGLAQAFQKYAEAAIAANGGVATDAIKTQAAMHGLEVTTDSTGRAIVKAMDKGKEAMSGFASSVKDAQGEVQGLMGYMDRLEKRNSEVKSSMKMDAQGFAADDKGNRIVAGGELTTLTGVASFLKAAGIEDEDTARRIAKEFSDGKGNIPYFSNPGQMKYGGDTISAALLKAAERVTFGGYGVGGAQVPGIETSIPKQTRTVTVNLNLNGESYGTVNTDNEGAAAIQNLVEELERAKRRAM